MIWIVIISLLIALLLWILIGPVILFVNTERNLYLVMLPGIIKAVVVPAEELFHIRGWIFFIPFKFNPFRIKRKRKKKEPKPVKKKKKRSISLSGGIEMGRSITRSFRIRKLHLNIDTDDFLLNAWLIPAFTAVNSRNIHMQANFEGDASLLLDLRTRLGSILWNLTRIKIKSLFNR
jgi:hypothetical protein